jgi:hypothetical protein
MTGLDTQAAVMRVARWMGTALPVGVCASIWLLGSGAGWLAMLLWTILRLAKRRYRISPVQVGLQMRTWLGNTPPALHMLYALLALQSVLAGFGHILAVDTALGRDITRVHGVNAVLLLALVGWQIRGEVCGGLFSTAAKAAPPLRATGSGTPFRSAAV